MVVFWVDAYVQPRAVSHESLNTNAYTFNDGKEDGTHDGAVSRCFVASSCSQGSSGEKPCNDGVVWILLLSNAFDGTIKSTKHAAPNPKVASCNWRACFDSSDHAYPPFAVWGISVALDPVP